jgi:peptide deformylase
MNVAFSTMEFCPMNYKIEGRIYTMEEPILREVGVPIVDFSPELERLFKEMHAIMEEHNGIGIAAQQVGLALRCCVVDVRKCVDPAEDFCILNGQSVDPAEIMPLYICNPEILEKENLCSAYEGCLSVPDFQSVVERSEIISVKFSDHRGKVQQIRCNGILARCMQHEFDHLDGKLFIDRLPAKVQKKFQRFLKNK